MTANGTTTTGMLDRAIVLAANAHAGQKRKDGSPYILHPLRLMLTMGSETEMIVAVLHDTVEDTGITLGQLREEGFTENILEALDLLTHRPSVPYPDYIEAIKGNSIATKVKIADLKDNLNTSAMPALTDKDLDRVAKYRQALSRLQN